MRRIITLLALLALVACANPDHGTTQKDGGIGGTGLDPLQDG